MRDYRKQGWVARMMTRVNWGEVSAWAGAALCLASAIGYAAAHDLRRALYYLFAFAITVTVIWR